MLITKVDLYQLEYIYIYVHTTVLSGRMLMVTSVTFYYYHPPLSPLASVRGLPTLIPAPPFACAENRPTMPTTLLLLCSSLQIVLVFLLPLTTVYYYCSLFWFK